MKNFSLWLLLLSLVTSSALAVEVSFERDATLPIVYLNVAFKTGSAADPAGQTGVTHFLGEMLLRGTQTRSREDITQQLDQLGAQLEVETRAEAMIVRGAVLTSQLEPYLRLVLDVLTHPRFSSEEIRKLKAQISSEILEEQGRDQSSGQRHFTRFLFQGHPYGKPIFGTRAEVRSLTAAQIEARYQQVVREKLMLVTGSGDAPITLIHSWAQGLAFARAGGELPPVVAAPQDSSERRMLLVDKPDRTQTQVFVGQVGLLLSDPRFFALNLANHAFGGGSFQARLMQEIRSKRGWSYGAQSAFRFGLRPRSWMSYTFPATKDTVGTVELLMKMLEDLRQNGITDKEFEFSRRSLIAGSGFMSDTPRKRVENKILEKTLNLPDGYMSTFGTETAKLNLGQVNAAIKDYFKPNQVAITVLCTAAPLKEGLIKAAGVAPAKVTVIPYTQD